MHLGDLQPLIWLLALLILAFGFAFSLVDRPLAKRVSASLLRALAVVLIVLAVCEPSWRAESERVHSAYVVDVSASVDLDGVMSALDEIDESIGHLRSGDSWSLIAMGSGTRRFATVEEFRQTLSAWIEGLADEDFRAGSDLSGALDAVRLTLPANAGARVTLFTDAKPTGHAIDEALHALDDSGVDLRLRPVPGLSDPEVAVVGITPSPAYAFEGQVVRLRTTVMSNTDTQAELRIVHSDVVVERRPLELTAGKAQVVEVSVPMLSPGRSVWMAEILSESDHFIHNNSASCTINVSGRARVLVLHEDPNELRSFRRAMSEQDIIVEVRKPGGVPRSLEELLAFDAVVLSDIAATDFQTEQLEMLRVFVADFGGGLAMLGSENSFGLGGYYQTPVEEALPLTSRYEQEKEQPSLAMVLVIDKSGSMSGTPIALARQAAKAAVDLLSSRDQIGVVGFDQQAVIAVEMQPAVDTASIQSSIDRMDAGGGTYMYQGMLAGYEMLERTGAKIKHMIVLGDGQTVQADHEGLIESLGAIGVTVSMVALGGGADRSLMSRLAELGRGRYYETMDPSTVPQIFTRETMQASRSAIKETVSGAVPITDHPMMSGFREATLPLLFGFVMTRAKPTSHLILATETGEPLLAVCNYGLGSGLAYTSDLTDRWGGEWLAWPGFGQFWAQALRSIIRPPGGQDLVVQSEIIDDLWTVRLQHEDIGVDAASIHPWIGEVMTPAGRTEKVEVVPVGVGRYALQVPLRDRSALTLRLVDPATASLRILHYDRPYPEEYNLSDESDEQLMALERFDPGSIRTGLSPAMESYRLAPWFLLLSVCCVVAGVVLRRV